MADLVYLSLWLQDFSADNMLVQWAKALQAFPVSSLAPGIREIAVHPLNWGEAPVLEQSFEEGAKMEEVVPLAAEFLHDDYAYEAVLNWDVWLPQSEDSLDQWQRVPQPVAVACIGPRFEEEPVEGEEQPHFLLNLGLDSILLPGTDDEEVLAEALEGVAANCYRENIAQLLGYIRKLDATLPLARRRLWSSSGEDLAARIRSAFGQ